MHRHSRLQLAALRQLLPECCTRRQLEAVDGLMTPVDVPAGREFRVALGRECVLVEDGVIELSNAASGRDTRARGAWIGFDELQRGAHGTATARAPMGARLRVVATADFARLLDVVPSLRTDRVVCHGDRASRRQLSLRLT